MDIHMCLRPFTACRMAKAINMLVWRKCNVHIYCDITSKSSLMSVKKRHLIFSKVWNCLSLILSAINIWISCGYIGFTVTNVALVREGDRYFSSPSKACQLLGIANEPYFLMEPCRSKSQTKHSGSILHPEHESLCGLTISALAHFIYEESEGTIVIADVQGMCCPHQMQLC